MVTQKAFREKLELNRIAFEAIRDNARCEMTEEQVQKTIRDAWFQASRTEFPFSGDIVSGVRSADIEGPATDKPLQSGDALIVDLQPGFDGCYADTTRTFFFGEPTEEMKKAYAAALDALEQMQSVLRPGVSANRIYDVMQKTLAQYGYHCPHHAGHAVGEEKFLQPQLVEQCDAKLKKGMLIALEPGVYVPGCFGIRIENNYRITEDGCEELFRYPLDMDYFIIRDGGK